MKIQRNKRGFTLFELMVGMVIFALIMTSVLESVGNITIARTRTMNRIALLEELYFFSEKLATSIKDGGIIDYEEYWNRKVVGTATQSGHYMLPTGYGNYGTGGIIGSGTYGAGYYYCRSDNGTRMGTGGCLDNGLNSFAGGGNAGVNYSGSYQRYGQYALQFNDYNGNADADAGGGSAGFGDEDLNGTIIGDEDDKDIGDGPTTLSGAVPELYLINNLTNERVYFRWVLRQDPGLSTVCDASTGSGCLGNIEVLKLRGEDLGPSHSGSLTESGSFDGKIDTWFCHRDWSCAGPSNTYGTLPTGADSEWIRLFPDYVNVKQLSFSLYPIKDPWKSWSAPDCLGGLCGSSFISPFLHPYVRLQMTMGLAWERRRLIKGDDPTISVSTTISLTGY